MSRESEVRFLDIDIKYVKEKLLSCGYVPSGTRFLQKRWVFDVDREKHAWLRLLSKEGKTTLAYKRVVSSEIDGTEEIEVSVDDFETTKKLLEKLGMKPKGYQENYRTLFRKNDVEATIDEWPELPPYLEIEAPDKETVEKAIEELNLKYSYTTKDNLEIYKDHGIDLHNTKELKF